MLCPAGVLITHYFLVLLPLVQFFPFPLLILLHPASPSSVRHSCSFFVFYSIVINYSIYFCRLQFHFFISLPFSNSLPLLFSIYSNPHLPRLPSLTFPIFYSFPFVTQLFPPISLSIPPCLRLSVPPFLVYPSLPFRPSLTYIPSVLPSLPSFFHLTLSPSFAPSLPS